MRVGLIMMAVFLMPLQTIFAQLPIKRDDFTHGKERLWWQYDLEGTANAALSQDGVMSFGMASADSTIEPWCNTSIWDGHNIYGDLTVTIRARALTPVRPGSRGWGLWFTTPLSAPSQHAWFMEVGDDPAEPTYDSTSVYWQIQAANYKDSPIVLEQFELSQAIMDWHTYKIVRDMSAPEEYIFYVDGVEVYRSINVFIFDPLSVQIWNDNLVYYFNPPRYNSRSWSGGTEDNFIVDYVEILTEDHPDSSYTPAGTMLLREVPQEMGSGADSSLWKTYNFTSVGGTYLILATGRAEQYGSWGDDDDMRFVVDGTDYGWNTIDAFNGDSLDGDSKTIVLQQTFTAGSKTIQVYEDHSPLLYDVTVLGSEFGKVILNQTVNETAPGGTDYLWKTYNFNCEEGEVAIYISGSADPDSTPTNEGIQATDFDNTEDDDLRVVLDGTDYEYNTPESLRGNGSYSEAKSILIRENLSSGSHTLELYADQTPTVYQVVIYGENEDEPLPVDLSNFRALRSDNQAELEWSTRAEVNNLGFHIYRAVRGADSNEELVFVRLTQTMIEGAGNTNQTSNYSYTDERLPEDPDLQIYYELEQIDLDGTRKTYGPIELQRRSAPISRHTLAQNYPNPFNAVTNIPFELSADEDVTLQVYDVNGRLIRTLHEGRLPGGQHNFFWDGNDNFLSRAGSGLYFYRLSAGRFVETRKMLLVN